MRRARVAVVGMGYIGASHIDAVRRLGGCELYAVTDVNLDLARAKAEAWGVPRVFESIEELLACQEVDAVHNCTPTHMHTEINLRVLQAGKHLLSEKPLAGNYGDALRCARAASERPELVAGVNFNYRMNPMVRDMRRRVLSGEAGEVFSVTGCYLQDWLLYDTDYSWRLDPARGGASCAVADIGSHWMDLAQHVTGLSITEVCADMRATHPARKEPLAQAETFSTPGASRSREVHIETEDYASVLFRFENGARGAFTASEMCAGHGCYFQIELSCQNESLMWNQESNDRLWVGRRGGENSLVVRDPGLMDPEDRAHTQLAKGHPEGWNDAFLGNIRAFYKRVTGDRAGRPDFATMDEAARLVRLTEACVESARQRRWVAV